MPKKKVTTVAFEMGEPPAQLSFKDKVKALWERHAWSIFTTFLASFLATLVPFIDSLGSADIERSVVLGILIAGVRAGVKAIIESFIKSKF